MVIRKLLTLSVLMASLLAGVQSVSAQSYSDESYCNKNNVTPAKRQTAIVIDSALITPEPNGPKSENKYWRQRIARFVDANDQAVSRRFAPREPVTILVAEADGSGLRKLFYGCMPLYSAAEQKELEKKTSKSSRFFGKDWKARLKKDNGNFAGKVLLSLVANMKEITPVEEGLPFQKSGLGQSVARGYQPSLEYGVPRLIIVTDLSKYSFQDGEVPAAKKKGREHSAAWGGNFFRGEVHILGATQSEDLADKEYLKSLFLGSKGNLITIAGFNGALVDQAAPDTVTIYQGTIQYPDGEYPIAMRLALDSNRRAVNSWIEIQTDELRFVPFYGALSCKTEKKCTFIETGNLAQIWTDSPGGEPEFEQYMPFVGFRDMKFSILGNAISGAITDSSGEIPGMKDGLKFEMVKVENGTF
jgi:hypothetical protein